MKTTLTIEESGRLIELGVDPKMASMVSWKQTENWQRKSVLDNKEHLQLKPFRPMVMGFERFDCKDIFTLTDLLSILPKEIDGYHLTIEASEKGYDVGYELYDSFEDRTFFMGSQATTPELIDALYQLLIWCLEQGYCKCGEGGGR